MSELCHPLIFNPFLLDNINNINILQSYYILSILLAYYYSTSNIIFVILSNINRTFCYNACGISSLPNLRRKLPIEGIEQ